MKLKIVGSGFVFIAVAFVLFTMLQIHAEENKPARAQYFLLTGEVVSKGNPVEKDGNIHQIKTPFLRLMRTKSNSSRGTILFLSGGGYEILELNNEIEKRVRFLNAEGFDVAILEYHIGSNPEIRDPALFDALDAFRLLKSKRKSLGLRGDLFSVIGIASGGHLAARLVLKLDEKDQPSNLILLAPLFLNEKLTGTVFPAVMPPVKPSASLLVVVSAKDNSLSVAAGREYSKIWKGSDAPAAFVSVADNKSISGILKSFLAKEPEKNRSEINPAAIPVPGSDSKRHAEKLALVSKTKYDLIMIGNSITNNFEKPEYQPIWKQFFAPRKALNLGFSGYRTENILWNLQNGELEGQSPKVIVLEIGTNNIDEKNYPTRHTAGQLAGGIGAIIKLLREKLPETKIIILRCFPGCYDGSNPTSHRVILDRASDIVSGFADRKNVFYCDVNHAFLNFDGSINHVLMPDWLHPSPAGAKAWAQAMEPLLSELMGDRSLDTEIPANNAIVPVSKIENDIYNWWARHAEILSVKDSINPEIILIGNSITHFWGGEPRWRYLDGRLRAPNGPQSWDSLFGRYRVLNLGFGWDRTQNVLWRLDNGELDGLHPRVVVINIGTNNTAQTENVRMNTAAEIADGIQAVCARVRSKIPTAKIILMAVFPREQSPLHWRRKLINEINKLIELFAKENKIDFVDLAPGMLAADGTFLPDMTLDYCHPADKGYQVWADAIRPIISKP
jgi:lysophospholipase L1-like esterase